jgi:hypothetical protein
LVNTVFSDQPKSELSIVEIHENSTLVDSSIPETISYNFDVKPILSDKCYKCHGPDPSSVQADFRLDISNDWYRPSMENDKKKDHKSRRSIKK